jgi:hypothetical protein
MQTPELSASSPAVDRSPGIPSGPGMMRELVLSSFFAVSLWVGAVYAMWRVI